MSALLTAQSADPRDEVARLRVPPHSMEAEQSILGGLLLDNSAWDRAGDLLTDSDFYRYEHRLIYAARTATASRQPPACSCSGSSRVLRSTRVRSRICPRQRAGAGDRGLPQPR